MFEKHLWKSEILSKDAGHRQQILEKIQRGKSGKNSLLLQLYANHTRF